MDSSKIDSNKIEAFINDEWNKLMPTFLEILSIPSQSRIFDPEQSTNGLLLKTVHSFRDWILAQNLKGLKLELLHDEGCQPFIFIEIEGMTEETILFYGHMDKQPPFSGWREGLDPYKPMIVDGKLYARGAADDHYSIFGSILSTKACQVLGYPHPRIIMIFESDEESGSADIRRYIDKLKDKIGKVDIVFCLDSGCGNYSQFWLTSTLRGQLAAVVNVKVLKEGVHSGDASGIVPSSFRIFRQLLDRIEDSKTGQVIDDFQVTIPGESYLEAYKTAQLLGNEIIDQFPFITEQMESVSKDPVECYLNRIWRAQLAVVGADGLPKADVAGNVLRPETKLKLSLRLPPTKDPEEAKKTFIKLLTEDVPYNATVEILQIRSNKGFKSVENQPYLTKILNESSLAYFKKEMLNIGEGGSIPLMNLLQDLYPTSQFVITGVIGPFCNAHGPNEMLDIEYCKKLICCLAHTVGCLAIQRQK